MTEFPMQQAISAVYRRLAHGAPRGTYAGYEHEMVDAYMRACAAGFARDGHTGLLSAATRGALDLLRQNGRAWAARLTGRSKRLATGWRRQRAGSARPPRPGRLGPVIQDVKTAYRSLARSPGFALGVALTLGLGIGATTTMYSVVNGVMLRPLPYQEPQALVAVGAVFPGREWDDERAGIQHLAGVSMLNYRDLKERARSFEELAAIEIRSVLLPDEGLGPELASAVSVSPEFFRALNLSPALGRTFLPEEYSTASEATFMLSYGAWQRRYGGDSAVVGRPLEQVGTPATVVGILPRDFVPPEALFSRAPDYWMPLQPDHGRYVSRGRRSLTLLGRLETGTSVEMARIEVASIADVLAAEFPDGVNDLHAETVGTTGRTLAIFLGASAMLLLLSAQRATTVDPVEALRAE